MKVSIETSFGIATPSEAVLDSLALNLFKAARAARGGDEIHAERYLEAVIIICNELARNKIYNIKED